MKIKSIKNARNGLAFIIAIELLAMQYYVPPFRSENSYELEQHISEESNGVSRKLSKKKNNFKFDSVTYSRNARNTLSKPNYYGKPRDF